MITSKLEGAWPLYLGLFLAPSHPVQEPKPAAIQPTGRGGAGGGGGEESMALGALGQAGRASEEGVTPPNSWEGSVGGAPQRVAEPAARRK